MRWTKHLHPLMYPLIYPLKYDRWERFVSTLTRIVKDLRVGEHGHKWCPFASGSTEEVRGLLLEGRQLHLSALAANINETCC